MPDISQTIFRSNGYIAIYPIYLCSLHKTAKFISEQTVRIINENRFLARESISTDLLSSLKMATESITYRRSVLRFFSSITRCLGPEQLTVSCVAPAQDISSPFSVGAETSLRPAPLCPPPQLRIILRRSPGACLVATGPTTPFPSCASCTSRRW